MHFIKLLLATIVALLGVYAVWWHHFRETISFDGESSQLPSFIVNEGVASTIGLIGVFAIPFAYWLFFRLTMSIDEKLPPEDAADDDWRDPDDKEAIYGDQSTY